MKFHFLFYVLIFILSVSCADNTYATSVKPYKRVAVFSGGGFEFAQFLGMMEALEVSNKAPDLIIATCGGGLAATIVANEPNTKLRRDFIMSPEFRALLRSTQPVESKIGHVTALYSWYNARKKEAARRLVPDIFKEYLVTIPNILPIPHFREGFVKSSIPIIVVGGKVLFTPEQVGQEINQKLYKEVFFTTPEVAAHIHNPKSAVAVWNPESSIEQDVEVSTDFHITEAARSSITSPFLLPPANINGQYFVGGSIDLYPLELAHSLGEEVIMSFGDGYGDSGAGQLVKATYQYSPNDRLQAVHDMSATWWVDFSDRDTFLKKRNGIGVKEGVMSLGYRMPDDDKTFNNDVNAHYQYGASRTLEALRLKTPNWKCHVREMDKRNSSLFLRKTCNR